MLFQCVRKIKGACLEEVSLMQIILVAVAVDKRPLT